jgi:hypothetical protein
MDTGTDVTVIVGRRMVGWGEKVGDEICGRIYGKLNVTTVTR